MSAPFLTDFPDRVSPMLVKELRQGLRAKTFIGVFLSLQIFLMVMLLSAGAASTSDTVGSIVSGVIFSFFGIAVLAVQPLRGINALSSEIKGHTIEMMELTRLSAFRIVFGKWVALVSQSALLLFTIIPYLILRYFFGGMNLIGEIVFLLLMFLTSMTLTAITVGLSGCSSVIVRAITPILGIPFLFYAIQIMSFSRMTGGSGGLMDSMSLQTESSRIGVAIYVAVIAYLTATMLSLGASLIAPAAENHSILRRLVAFFAMLVLLALAVFDEIDLGVLIAVVYVVAVPSIIIALTESGHLIATVRRPFQKLGALGRAVGVLLYPCWASGVLFSVLLTIISVAAIFTHRSMDVGEEEGVVVLATFGGLFFPAVCQIFLFKGEGQRIAHYLLILAGSLVMLGILALLTESMDNGDFLWCFVWNPLAFLPMLSESSASDETLFGAVFVVDTILLAMLVVRAVLDYTRAANHSMKPEPALEATE